MIKFKKECWIFPWKYRESGAISFALLLVGFLFDVLKIKAISFLFPSNFILLGLLLFVIIILSTKFSSSGLSRWFSSIYASISAILLFVLFSVVIALIPMNQQNIFVDGGITNSWMYHLVTFYMLLVLGVVACKKIVNYRRANISFILNHLGLWIVLFFASTSAYNISILRMNVNEGQTVWYAFDEYDNKVDLDFAIKLNEFDIDEYNPKIAFVDNNSGELIKETIKELDTLVSYSYKGLSVKANKFYKESVDFQGVYRHSNMPGAPASALIEIDGREQWISSGSYVFPSKICKLNDNFSLVMLSPEPKRYYSKITLYNKDKSINEYNLEVNKPIKVNGWNIYQKSYNKDMGKWSDLSVIELVRDPYLYFVYMGCLFMVIGSFFMIFKGKLNG